MDSTLQLLESLERVLRSTSSINYHDEFQVLTIDVTSLQDGLITIKSLLEEREKGIIEYDRAVVQVSKKGNYRVNVSLPIRRTEVDIELSPELLENNCLCNNHGEVYENIFNEQAEGYEFSEWRRYNLIQEMVDCANCDVIARVEIAFNKNTIENQIKERILRDIPQLTQGLENIRIFYWANLQNFYAMIFNNPRLINSTISNIGKPCLFISLENAENDGSDYFKSISTNGCSQRDILGPILIHLLHAPPLFSLSQSRKNNIQNPPELLGYLPPEYWLNTILLALAHTGEVLPSWFERIAPLFVFSLLTTVSSKTIVGDDNIGFEIIREFDLELKISIQSDEIEVFQEANSTKEKISQEILRRLLDFYSTALQGKFTSINQDLIQRSIIYGTNFAFDEFFSQLDRIIKFYGFEYRHLLGDRFEQQSHTLSTFIGDMMGLRQQLASLIDSLSKDLSGLTIAVLATTALAIAAKVIDITNSNNLVIYGIVTSFIFSYFYITVFLLRIDNLMNLGERAVKGFINDIERSQKIWDFPLHSIGVEDKDLDKEQILKPLISQHNTNQFIGEMTGFTAHILILLLALSMNLWWFPVPILILDCIFLINTILSKKQRSDRIFYYSFTYLITLIFAFIAYWFI